MHSIRPVSVVFLSSLASDAEIGFALPLAPSPLTSPTPANARDLPYPLYSLLLRYFVYLPGPDCFFFS